MVDITPATTVEPTATTVYEYTLVGGELWCAYWSGVGVSIELSPDTTRPDFVIPLNQDSLGGHLEFTQLTFAGHLVRFTVTPFVDTNVSPFFRLEVQ